jgi:pimeloyl-ACP methyl ester carboxylesterase
VLSIEGYLTTEDGVRLYFRKFGNGPKAVIIPNAVHMFESFRHLAGNHTIIFFDLRNRGRSESVSDPLKLARGIHHDVEDLEAVRRHFQIEQVELIGHSYVGLLVILYVLKYPDHVHRIVQIGPAQPNAATQYPPHLTGADATFAAFLSKLAQPRNAGCGQFWELVRVEPPARDMGVDQLPQIDVGILQNARTGM